MSDTSDSGAGSRLSGLAPVEWSLRSKVALAVLIPITLAAIFGGLRVRNDLAEADSFSASADQVSVLRPAVDYLNAVETAVVVARVRTAAEDPDRDAAVAKVVTAGEEFTDAIKSAGLTSAQREQADSVMDLSEQLRSTDGYVSVGQSVSQLNQLQSGVLALIDTIVSEQRQPEARLQLLGSVIDGRASLTIQQFSVAYQDGVGVKPIDLAAELGVEAAAIDRLAASMGIEDADVAALRAQNAAHFGAVRDGGTDLGDATAYAPYDRLSSEILEGIDKTLADAADDSQRGALLNSVITLAALLAAILLALLVSRLLLDPIRRVREGALLVAQEKLPEAVRRIREGGDPGEIEPIPVTTHEEMGQLARAVDSLHQEAVNMASGEAKLREQVGQMFQTLSRRSTSLVNQQLGLIETLEKDEEDPKRLESLFRLDHLASRMRRTADSLNVLADAPPAASDPHGLTVNDVLQAALAGVQEYQRVQIQASATERVAGVAASDAVHLVTELVDNALSYSPPSSTVLVTTKKSPEGVVIKVSDAGLGMKDDAMAALNNELRSGGEITPETARRMGLLVVARLAKRHGMFVELERNAQGGVTASIVLPAPILRTSGQPIQSLKPVPAPTPAPASAFAPIASASMSETAHSHEVEEPAAPTRVEAVEETAPVAPAAEAPGALVTPAAAAHQVAVAPAPALPVRQKPEASPVAGPGADLAARLQSMREAREAANLSNAGTPATRLPTPSAASAASGSKDVDTDSISAAIDAVMRLPQRSPGSAEVPGQITPLSATLDPEVAEVPEPAVVEVAEEFAAPEPVSEPEADLESELESESAIATLTPIPVATTTFSSVLDAGAPIPDLLSEEGSIFASMRSNWFSSDGTDQPWSGNEIDTGWQAADRVAEATPLQVSEAGLPVRRPGTRIVPGGVAPATATLVRDPEAIRARLAAHAAGVNRGRKVANGPVAVEATDAHTHAEHSQEVDPS